MRINRQTQQAGFTLVEMLVVIVIIGILAAMLIPAVGAARKRVIDGRIAAEVANVERAMEAYKQARGDYPPNSNDVNLLKRHMETAFPKIDNAELIAVSTLLSNFLDPAEAIPFWLGGFSSNPKYPFTGSGGPLVFYGGSFYANPNRTKNIMDFDQGRLTLNPSTVLDAGPPEILGQLSNDADGQSDSFPVYLSYSSKMPMVYFDHRSYGNPLVHYPPIPNDQTGAAKPYLSDRARPVTPQAPLGFEWLKKDSFQIISAGRDNHYGSYAFLGTNPPRYPVFPIGTNYDPSLPLMPAVAGFPGQGGDNDNIANFSEGKKLEDKKP